MRHARYIIVIIVAAVVAVVVASAISLVAIQIVAILILILETISSDEARACWRWEASCLHLVTNKCRGWNRGAFAFEGNNIRVCGVEVCGCQPDLVVLQIVDDIGGS